MAEGLFRRLVERRGDYEIASAGVAALAGQPASGHTLSVLREEKIDLAYFRSQPLTRKLAAQATHIFVMTRGHHAAVEDSFPEAADKTYLVTEFCADPAVMGDDIPDPIGMGREAYIETRTALKKALPSLVAFIDQTFPKKSAAAPAPAERPSPAMNQAATASNSAPTPTPSSPTPTVGDIFFGADHGGVDLKEALVASLRARGVNVHDLGTHGSASVDYTDFVPAVLDGVLADPANRGVLICTTGVGMSITANRTPGIQAALVQDEATARITREHNDANVLCLAGATK